MEHFDNYIINVPSVKHIFKQQWLKRSSSRCFQGHNLHFFMYAFCNIFFLSQQISLKFYNIKRVISAEKLCNKKYRSPWLFTRKQRFISLATHASRIEKKSRYFVNVCANHTLRALMRRKFCVVRKRAKHSHKSRVVAPLPFKSLFWAESVHLYSGSPFERIWTEIEVMVFGKKCSSSLLEIQVADFGGT